MRHPLLLSILAVLPGCADTFVTDGCLVVDEGTTTCPAPKSVDLDELSFHNECRSDIEVVEIQGSGELRPSAGKGLGSPACCYPVEVIDHDPNTHCIPGRPYIVSGLAQLRLSTVSLELNSESDATRAHAWALAGAAEHASVAAFNRLSLQLLALGAPLDLLRAVQRAALEEVHHAEACFKVARELGGRDISLGAFPFGAPIDPHVNLAELAYAAVREGCLAETLGAVVMANVAALVPTQSIRTVVERLCREESEHAVLSFRIVAWALQTGGPEVKAAVDKALNEPWPWLDSGELALRLGVARSLVEHATHRAYRQVLRPAAKALASAQA